MTDYIFKFENRLNSSQIADLFWAFARHVNISPKLYEFLFKEMAFNYINSSPRNKVLYLRSFAKKGQVYKEVVETICYDIIKDPESYIENTPEILGDLCELNLEDQEYFSVIRESLLETFLERNTYIISNVYYSLLWALVKSNSPARLIDKVVSIHERVDWSPKKGFRYLLL